MLFRFSLATLALLGISAGQVFAQNPSQGNNAPTAQGPKVGPTSVALVDVGAIIKAHPTMTAEMDKIKAEMEAAHETLEGRRKSLLNESETIAKTYDLNSPDFKQKQEELLNKESKLRVDFLGQEKDFAEKQATVVYKSYKDIDEAIKTVANHYKFDLVLRFSKEQDEMDPKKPQTVNYGLQRDVLFQSPGLDITDIVLYVLKGKYPGVTQPVTGSGQGSQAKTATGNSNNGVRR